jgi:alkaline phosphatase D
VTALRPPGLGPIIGHTDHESCRLWIQASDPEDPKGDFASNRRTVGVIGRLSADRQTVEHAFYFRLQREFDRTGTFVLGKDVNLGRYVTDCRPGEDPDTPVPLQADTEYTVRMGTLSLDDPLPDEESISDRDLIDRLPLIQNMAPLLLQLPVEESEATFRTFPALDAAQAHLAFLVGSCRYPGLLWKIKEADIIFAPMQKHLDRAAAATSELGDLPTARFSLMVGDQIYADALNRFVPVDRADTYLEFQERYQTAFGSPNMRHLLRTAPTYMILDDHEIEDNWTQDRLVDGGESRLFNFAIGAYMSYQWSHGPRTWGRRLYYRFDCGEYPFFVLDTRTQRFKDDETGLADMLGRPTIDTDPEHQSQLHRLLDWLAEQQQTRGNAPKFAISSSVFVPNAINERIMDGPPMSPESRRLGSNTKRRADSDSWPAYPETRQAILEQIASETPVQNVVFLTGDIHCSNIARMYFENADGQDRGIFAYDITSSAFYWPFPFADGDPNSYVHDSKASGQTDGFPISGGEMNYRSWGFTQQDNYCRIDIDRQGHEMQVRYYDRDGGLMSISNESGGKTDVNVLPLAAWP